MYRFRVSPTVEDAVHHCQVFEVAAVPRVFSRWDPASLDTCGDLRDDRVANLQSCELLAALVVRVEFGSRPVLVILHASKEEIWAGIR